MTPLLDAVSCRFRELPSLADSRGRRYGLWFTLVSFFIAAFAVGMWAFAPEEQDPYTSPATSAFRSIGAPVPDYDCDEGMLLGGSRVAKLSGVDSQSSDEQVVMAVEGSLRSTGLTRIAHDLKVSNRKGSLRVLTAGSADRVATAVVVEEGGATGSVGSSPDGGAASLAIVAVAFCG